MISFAHLGDIVHVHFPLVNFRDEDLVVLHIKRGSIRTTHAGENGVGFLDNIKIYTKLLHTKTTLKEYFNYPYSLNALSCHWTMRYFFRQHVPLHPTALGTDPPR